MNLNQFTKLEDKYNNEVKNLHQEAVGFLTGLKSIRKVAIELDINYQELYRIANGERKHPDTWILRAIVGYSRSFP